ncbi:MAG: hypothetical protein EXR62_14590 [Chloroflexi bacterium]|nr:hypothetical protein [Chloroflexota bacterium]
MTKYVLLATGGTMPETEAETAEVMKAWGAWYEKLGSAVVDPGNPLSPVAKNIASNGTVSDDPMGGKVTGYIILQAGSLDEAVGMAKACPALQGGSALSVFEAVNMM